MGGRRGAALCLMAALLCAGIGGGGGAAEASLEHGGVRGGGFFSGRHRSSSTNGGFLRASVAVGLALWSSGAPPFAVLAASHLRVDPFTGRIEELPEAEIAEDAVAFHTPVQHPGGQRPGSQEDNNKILYPGQWHSWTSLGAALGSISSQSHHTPSSADNDTCDTCEGGGVGANANANNAYSGGGTGQATGGGGLQQTTYSAPSPSSWSSTSGAGGDGTLVNGAMNNLPLVGLSAGPTVPLGSATTHPSTPGGKRYHPEPALAVLFDRYGGVDTALQVLTRTTAQNGNDPVMWSDLGNAHRVKGDSDKAIECFESALRLQPHPDFFLNLGGVRFVLGEVDEAIRLFTLGLQMNPRHVLLQFSMGNAYAMQGRKEEAARSFEATLRIQPDFAAAEQYLRTLRREMKQQWWPNWWIVAAVALFVVACAGVQRTVQYYAMGGAAAPGGGGNNDGRITGDPRYPSGVSVDGVLGVFGVGGGGGSRHLNDVVGGHVSGGGVKQRRKGRH